jgi:glycosyltransferase involved in cell wall biosynthesis
MATHSVSIVIPVFNSEATLSCLMERLEAAIRLRSLEAEVILVNDGSRDGSWKRIVELTGGREWLRGVDLMRNYGQHNALLCGIRLARHDVIVTMDDDLQNPPEGIPRLLDKLDEGFDVVYGTPRREQHGLWRDLASGVTKLALQSAMGVETARDVSAFRAFRASLRNAFEAYRGPFVSIDVLLTWATARFTAIPVDHNPRLAGVSNYTFGRLVRHALNMMTGFSTLPLRLASLIGFLCTLFGLGVLALVLVRYLIQGATVAGFPFLASVIAIFSGAQLFALGIIGEYLARMHFRLMERPPYSVREYTRAATMEAARTVDAGVMPERTPVGGAGFKR